MSNLTMHEGEALRRAIEIMRAKPEATLVYLGGKLEKGNRQLIAMALKAQLDYTRTMHDSMKVTTALCEFLISQKEQKNETTSD